MSNKSPKSTLKSNVQSKSQIQIQPNWSKSSFMAISNSSQVPSCKPQVQYLDFWIPISSLGHVSKSKFHSKYYKTNWRKFTDRSKVPQKWACRAQIPEHCPNHFASSTSHKKPVSTPTNFLNSFTKIPSYFFQRIPFWTKGPPIANSLGSSRLALLVAEWHRGRQQATILRFPYPKAPPVSIEISNAEVEMKIRKRSTICRSRNV